MAVFNVTEAVRFLGKTVLMQLRFVDDGELYEKWCFVRIGGVMLEFQDFWRSPYFLGFEVGAPSRFPNEYFWDDISSISIVSDRRYRIRSVLNGRP